MMLCCTQQASLPKSSGESIEEQLSGFGGRWTSCLCRLTWSPCLCDACDRNHKQDMRAAASHKTYPLFATCSEDATAHVFHGMVYSDLLQNPLIVPVKVLRGHQSGTYVSIVGLNLTSWRISLWRSWALILSCTCIVANHCIWINGSSFSVPL